MPNVPINISNVLVRATQTHINNQDKNKEGLQ